VPDARTTMLSDFDGERFFFHTDANSRKAAELAADPGVALTILWPGFTRQLVVQGRRNGRRAPSPTRPTGGAPPYLQQLAWQNTASSRSCRSPNGARWDEFLRAHGGADDPSFTPPEAWAGFAVTPHRLVFWVSNPIAASRRIAYTREAAGWTLTALPG
jgi:pyridoxamine 5'-phosphate oxidase